MTDADQAGSLAQILNPRSIAVVGASEDLRKFGSRLFNNIAQGGYQGDLIPINPKRTQIFGYPTKARVADLDAPVDVVIIVVPREAVLENVTASAALGVKCCVIITAGFGEIDAAGAVLERQLVDIARSAGMRLIGPNCLGGINTHASLQFNSSPSMENTPIHAGGIGFATQSGALMATVYNRGVDDGARFSHAISVGNQADLELADFIGFMADDPHTLVITLYVEGLKNPARFLAAVARCRAAGKPVLLVKAGRSVAGARVTLSHTASMASSHRVFSAICREAGIIALDDVPGMIQAAEFLSRFPSASAAGIGVISGSGGAAAITADRLADRGLNLAPLAAETRARLEEIFEPTQLGNPIDTGAMREKSFMNVDDGGLAIAAADPGIDTILVALTTGPALAKVTRRMGESAAASGKPAIFVIMPGSAADEARAKLRYLNVFVYETLDEALRVLECARLGALARQTASNATRPAGMVDAFPDLDIEPGQLNEHEAKQLLRAYGLPVNAERIATSVDEACQAAATLGYPVVLKTLSRDLAHKSDAGGVALNLSNERELCSAWLAMDERLGATQEGRLIGEMVSGCAELIIGIQHDPEFGPMVLFGIGGVHAEVFDDVQMVPAPVSQLRALTLLQTLKLWPLLDGSRGQEPADVTAVAQAISRLSWLAHDAGQRIKELDINPLIVRATGQGAVAVDAFAVLASLG